MQLSNAPSKIKLPFANSGTKNTIPVPSQIGVTPGLASYTDGFPPLTFTPVASGGVPPYGADFNGVLNAITAINRWNNAGAGFVYDSSFATDLNVGGYPQGAKVLRTDGLGYWLNTSDNNTTDPEAGGDGWIPDYQAGNSTITMTSSNVTLTSLQAGLPFITITGTLTSNLNLIFPVWFRSWTVVNNTTGSFTITAKTASGSGVVLAQGQSNYIFCNGTNILYVNANPFGLCKAWVNFDGRLTGSISPRGSYNISSITKNATGDYSLTFSTPLANANYAVTGMRSDDGTATTGAVGLYDSSGGGTDPTASGFRITVSDGTGAFNAAYVMLIVMGA